ncbi:MAG: RING finger protein [Candidatus Promineifilaceae bacterium]|nr:RING finger protein [Candidatus Promineifilaceae bacterium]
MPAQSFIRPVKIDRESPFRGEACALCKEPFAVGEELVICPEDASRHHSHCWRANDNKCTAYGCAGTGEILPRHGQSRKRRRPQVITQRADYPPRTKVRTMPSSSMGCAQACLIVGVAIAIVLIAAGCFGLWAIADYILLEVLGWQYRSPFTGVILPAHIWVGISDLILRAPF